MVFWKLFGRVGREKRIDVRRKSKTLSWLKESQRNHEEAKEVQKEVQTEDL